MKLIDPRLGAAYDRIATDAEPSSEEGCKGMFVWNHFYMGMDGKASLGASDGRGKNRLKAGEKIASVYNYNRKKNVHRATFLNEMIALLPGGTGKGKVTFRKRLAELVDLEDGEGVELQFTDGTTETADAVIGCDGVKSRIRQILLEGLDDSVEPRFTGKYAYRGLIPMEEALTAIGDIARNSHMTCGYGGHLVNFPVDKGQTLNVVAFQTKEEWDHGKEWVVPATIEDVLADYRDWDESVRKLLSMLKKPDKWGLFEHKPASTYHQGGKICLLGDCAHASSPHQGAGAGMAIEDAAVLSTLLGKIKGKDSSELERAFRAYDSVRRPRTQKLVTTSRDAGILYDFQKAGVGDDQELIKQDLLQRMKWIWDVDMDQHCKDAAELMNQ